MRDHEIQISGIPGIPEIVPGDDLGSLITDAVRLAGKKVVEGDIFVIAQKIVSKAGGKVVEISSVVPSPRAQEWAAQYRKDARVVEIVLRETRRLVRMERGILIAETKHGFICANAGVDTSNVAPGTVTLLPDSPDDSAQRLKADFENAFQTRVAVLISDTFGRPWREGLVNVALGVAGLAPLIDYRGLPDAQSRPMQVTIMAAADELASAAELVMGKTTRIPAAIIRGFQQSSAEGSGRDLIRAPELDLFR